MVETSGYEGATGSRYQTSNDASHLKVVAGGMPNFGKNRKTVHSRDIWYTTRTGDVASKGGPEGNMDDKDVRRLEDRIEAYNREASLKIQKVNDEFALKLERLAERQAESFKSIEQENKETRRDLKEWRAESRSEKSEVKRFLIGTAIATVVALAGIMYSGLSLWATGFTSGQGVSQPKIESPTR